MTDKPFRLLLIRHAKAAEGSVDIERALTDRGRRDAQALGRWLAKHQLLPDLAAVSPAIRAQQTWQFAVADLTDPPPTETARAIYENTPEALLAVAAQAPDDARSLAIVGHNPSIAHLAAGLDDGSGDATARGALAAGFPTGSVAVFTLATPFEEVAAGGGTLTDFHTARG